MCLCNLHMYFFHKHPPTRPPTHPRCNTLKNIPIRTGSAATRCNNTVQHTCTRTFTTSPVRDGGATTQCKNTLQHTATHCNTHTNLHEDIRGIVTSTRICTATATPHCNKTLQHNTATHSNTPARGHWRERDEFARSYHSCKNTLQQNNATHCNTLQHTPARGH